MFRIQGLTGQVCSGKSTFCEYLEKKYNYKIVNVDLINREVLTYPHVLQKIRKNFGDQVFDNEGNLNKLELRKIIFSDRNKKKVLEGITHSEVFKKLFKIIFYEKFRLNSRPMIIENAILLNFRIFSLGLYPIFAMITTDHDKLIERIMKRDKISKEVAENMLKNQLSLKEFKEKCDFCFDNIDTIENLEMQIDNFFDFLKKKI